MSCGRFWNGRGRWWLTVLLATAGCGGGPPPAVELRPVTATEVLAAVRAPGAKAVLVNMWATWCVPCRQEFPDLMNLTRAYRDRGLRVIFVSWDHERTAAETFLVQQGVDFPAFLKTGDQGDTQFIEQFEPRWSGAFPATMLYDGRGMLRDFWEGRVSSTELERRVLAVLTANQTGEQP